MSFWVLTVEQEEEIRRFPARRFLGLRSNMCHTVDDDKNMAEESRLSGLLEDAVDSFCGTDVAKEITASIEHAYRTAEGLKLVLEREKDNATFHQRLALRTHQEARREAWQARACKECGGTGYHIPQSVLDDKDDRGCTRPFSYQRAWKCKGCDDYGRVKP